MKGQTVSVYLYPVDLERLERACGHTMTKSEAVRWLLRLWAEDGNPPINQAPPTAGE